MSGDKKTIADLKKALGDLLGATTDLEEAGEWKRAQATYAAVVAKEADEARGMEPCADCPHYRWAHPDDGACACGGCRAFRAEVQQ